MRHPSAVLSRPTSPKPLANPCAPRSPGMFECAVWAAPARIFQPPGVDGAAGHGVRENKPSDETSGGGGSDFVGLCGRKPHGGASYVQMSKRNRNTPPLTGYCTALERYPGRIAGVHLAGLAAGESPRVATPPILCPQCLACEALPAKAGQAPRRTVDHCYEARTRGLCALPSGVDANARPRVEPGFPPDAAWHRPPPWPWCVGSRGLTLCERPGHAQRPRPSTPAMQNIGTN